MREIYVLDSGFRRQEVIDTYETLLWTERYSAEGEVVLTVSDTLWNRTILKEGAFFLFQNRAKSCLLRLGHPKREFLKLS